MKLAVTPIDAERACDPVADQDDASTSSSRPDPHAGMARLLDEAERVLAAEIDPAWRTPYVLELARDFANADPEAATKLGVALGELGCTNRVILDGLAEGDLERAAWLIELVAGARCGEIVAAHFGSTSWQPVARYHFTVNVPVHDTSWNLKPSAHVQPVMYECKSPHEPSAVSTWAITIHGGDLEANVEQVERSLRTAGAPAGVRLSWYDGDWRHRTL